MQVMIDTNVLARFADQDSQQHAEAVEALRVLQSDGHLPVFNSQIKREFLDIAERPSGAGPGKNGLGMNSTQARQLIQQFQAQFGYLTEPAVADDWFDRLHEKFGGGKTVHDLNIVASMLAHGVSSLLTFNEKHFTRFQPEGVVVQTPQQVIAAHGQDPR
jgi:predicted nucleic acid-binding protein